MERAVNTIFVVEGNTPTNIGVISGVMIYSLHYNQGGNQWREAPAIAGADGKPGFIPSDIAVLGMDGYGVCRRVEAAAETRDIPVISLTAKPSWKTRKKASKLEPLTTSTNPSPRPLSWLGS